MSVISPLITIYPQKDAHTGAAFNLCQRKDEAKRQQGSSPSLFARLKLGQ